jgi:hypothetical protein
VERDAKSNGPSKHQCTLFLKPSQIKLTLLNSFHKSCCLFLGGLSLSRIPRALLPGALRALDGAGVAQLHVGTALDGCGHVALLDLLDGLVGGGDGEGVRDQRNLLNLAGVGLGVALLGVVGLAGEDNEALLVGLEALDVGLEGLLG